MVCPDHEFIEHVSQREASFKLNTRFVRGRLSLGIDCLPYFRGRLHVCSKQEDSRGVKSKGDDVVAFDGDKSIVDAFCDNHCSTCAARNI